MTILKTDAVGEPISPLGPGWVSQAEAGLSQIHREDTGLRRLPAGRGWLQALIQLYQKGPTLGY